MARNDGGPALFPISLSNQAFSTENVLPLLPPIFARHSRVVFLVADRLQIYNKALRIGDGVTLPGLLQDFEDNQHYFNQRNRWIERLTHSISGDSQPLEWSVVGIEDLADAACFRIFRNVMLAYYALPAFRRDLDAAAHAHAAKRDEKYPLEQREALSRGYILEEIAVSIRLHVGDGLRHEYYLGQQSTPVLGIYKGVYGVSPADLAEASEEKPSTFYEPSPEGAASPWRELEYEDELRVA